MEWAKVKVVTSNEAIEAVTVILEKYGSKGVEIHNPQDKFEYSTPDQVYSPQIKDEEVSVTTWIPESEKLKPEEIKKEIEALKQYGLNPGEVKIYISFEDDVNWNKAWKDNYNAIPVSSNMIIIPVWDQDKFKDDSRIKILIDPGMAFGTGDHPTTILTLQALLLEYFPNAKVFDVGSGSGILSIAAAKMGATDIYATDIDQTTIENAEKNLKINGVSDQIRIKVGNLLNDTNEKADLILANILAEVHLELIPTLSSHLNEEGKVILGGIFKEKEATVVSELENFNFEVKERLSMKDWVSIIAQRKD